MWEKVGLKNGKWIERVSGIISHTFEDVVHVEESRFVLAEQKIASDYRNVLNLEKVSASEERKDYRNQFAHQNLRRGQAKKYFELLFTNWT